jgi:hypothetical protein
LFVTQSDLTQAFGQQLLALTMYGVDEVYQKIIRDRLDFLIEIEASDRFELPVLSFLVAVLQ